VPHAPEMCPEGFDVPRSLCPGDRVSQQLASWIKRDDVWKEAQREREDAFREKQHLVLTEVARQNALLNGRIQVAEDGVAVLNKLVRDGNGTPSLLTRASTLENAERALQEELRLFKVDIRADIDQIGAEVKALTIGVEQLRSGGTEPLRKLEGKIDQLVRDMAQQRVDDKQAQLEDSQQAEAVRLEEDRTQMNVRWVAYGLVAAVILGALELIVGAIQLARGN
jgi:hypothetical protein